MRMESQTLRASQVVVIISIDCRDVQYVCGCGDTPGMVQKMPKHLTDYLYMAAEVGTC